MDINGEIFLGKGLGGFVLGHGIANYAPVLEAHHRQGSLEFLQTGIYSCRYRIDGFPVEIYVDVRTGAIYKISACKGYLGKFRSVFVGMPVQNVLVLDLGFYYDECDEAFVSSGIQGIALEVSSDDPLPEEAVQMNVEYITVYDSQLFCPVKHSAG